MIVTRSISTLVKDEHPRKHLADMETRLSKETAVRATQFSNAESPTEVHAGIVTV
jgi:hypothetical protein